MRATRAERKELFTRGYVGGVIAMSWMLVMVLGCYHILYEFVLYDAPAAFILLIAWGSANVLLIYSSRHFIRRMLKWIAKPWR